MKKDSELFKPLVVKAEKYLRDYCDGKQADDERARVALRVLSVYRRILRAEREKEAIRSEWKKLVARVAEWKKLTATKKKQRFQKNIKAAKPRQS